MICMNYDHNKMFGLLKFHSGYGKFYFNSPKGYNWKIINAQTVYVVSQYKAKSTYLEIKTDTIQCLLQPDFHRTENQACLVVLESHQMGEKLCFYDLNTGQQTRTIYLSGLFKFKLVKFFWSSGIMDCILYTFDNRVPLMR